MSGPELYRQDQQALIPAFNDLAIARGLSIVPDAALQRGVRAMRDQHALLETVHGSADIRSRLEPALTACIPLAILNEDQSTMLRAVDVVAQAQQHLGEPVELILWANARYGDEERGTVEQAASEQYAALRSQLQWMGGSGLVIRTALQVLPKDEATMMQYRSNYMDAVAVDAIERGYRYSHPVLWLDADLSFLSRDTLAAVEAGVRNFDALLVHPVTIFTADWAKGVPMIETDVETRAFAACEIFRRQIARRTPANRILSYNRDYFEECGLACAIGTYCDARGLDTVRRIGESASLITNVEEVEVPDFLVTHRSDSPPIARYIPGVRVGMEGRRHYNIIQALGARGLIHALTDRAYNGPCVGMDVVADWRGSFVIPPITYDQVKKALLDPKVHGFRVGEDQRRVLGRVIDRYFEPAESGS